MRRSLFLPTVFILILFCFICVPASAQIRDLVFIIRPEFDPAYTAFIEASAEKARNRGYEEIADAIKKSARSGFGSAFAVSAPDGKDYLVTNRHVVADASKVAAEIIAKDGSLSSMGKCSILAVDDDLDLALLSLPDGPLPSNTPLSFASSDPTDGMEVWSAGYPGLGNKPSWQLGKGIITNSTARIAELVNPSKSLLLQHSAEVDPGNSGGPLLISDSTKKAGFTVIGVNTWKAQSRQATNFAIPAEAVSKFINKAILPMGTDVEKDLEQRLEDFTKLFSTSFDEDDPNAHSRHLSRYISFELVKKEGADALIDAVETSSQTERNEVIHLLASGFPIEAMRFSLAGKIASHADIASGSSASDMPVLKHMSGDRAEAEFQIFDSKNLELGWRREYGSWRLEDIPFTKSPTISKDKLKSANPIGSPYRLSFFLDTTHIDNEILPSLGFGFGGRYLVGGAQFGLTRITIKDSLGTLDYKFLTRMLGSVRAQITLATDFLYTIPFIDLKTGLQIIDGSKYPSGIMGYLGAGVQVIIGYDHLMFLSLAYGREMMLVGLEAEKNGNGMGDKLAFAVGLTLP